MATGIAVLLAVLGISFQVLELTRQTSWLSAALQWVQQSAWLPDGFNVPREIPLGPITSLLLFLALMIAIGRIARTSREARRLATRVVVSEHGIERIALQLAGLSDKVGRQMADLEGVRRHVNQLEQQPQLEHRPR